MTVFTTRPRTTTVTFTGTCPCGQPAEFRERWTAAREGDDDYGGMTVVEAVDCPACTATAA